MVDRIAHHDFRHHHILHGAAVDDADQDAAARFAGAVGNQYVAETAVGFGPHLDPAERAELVGRGIVRFAIAAVEQAAHRIAAGLAAEDRDLLPPDLASQRLAAFQHDRAFPARVNDAVRPT